jgi:hypothetical protein
MFSVRTASLAGLIVPAESGNDLMMEVAYWTGALVASVLAIVIAIVILRKLLKRDRDTKKVDAVFLDNLRTLLSPDEMRKVREVTLRKYTEEEKNKEDTLSVKDLQKTTEKAALVPQTGQNSAAPGNPGGSGRPTPGAAGPSTPAPQAPQPSGGKQPSRPTPGSVPLSDARRVSSGKVRYGAEEWDEKAKKRVVTSLRDILVSGGRPQERPKPAEEPTTQERPKPPEKAPAKEVLALKGEAAVKMKPVDVDMLLRRGLITEKEYERLKGYFEEEKK